MTTINNVEESVLELARRINARGDVGWSRDDEFGEKLRLAKALVSIHERIMSAYSAIEVACYEDALDELDETILVLDPEDRETGR